MKDEIAYWTKTSGVTGKSKIHLSGGELVPFCGLNTHHFEFGGKVVDVTESGLSVEYTKGTSVYQEQSYQRVESEFVCKKCLNKALKL